MAVPVPDNIETLPDKHAIAKRYGVSLRTVDKWVNDRKIPYLELGTRTKRFILADVEQALIKHHTIVAIKK
jgi:excisionase family DNA binding protein